MKKRHIILFSLAFMIVLSFTACGENKEKESKLPVVEPSVLYENSDYKVSLVSGVNEDILGYSFDIEIQNNKSHSDIVSTKNVCMDGVYMPDAGVQETFDVEAGGSTTVKFLILEKDLKEMRLDRIKDFKFKLKFSAANEVGETEYIEVKMPAKEGENDADVENKASIDGSGDLIVDEAGIKIANMGLKVQDEPSEIEKTVKLYVENNTDTDLYLRADYTKRILINDKESNVLLSHEMPANSKSYAYIYIDKAAFLEEDFDFINSIKLSFLVEKSELSDEIIIETEEIDFLK